jgi:hypothetical protein
MSVIGTKRTSRDDRSLVAIGGKRTWRLRAPTFEFDPTTTSSLINPEAGIVPFHTPPGRKVLVLAIARGMFSAGSNATT